MTIDTTTPKSAVANIAISFLASRPPVIDEAIRPLSPLVLTAMNDEGSLVPITVSPDGVIGVRSDVRGDIRMIAAWPVRS